MRSAKAPSSERPDRPRTLLARVLDLGVARVSVLAGRGLLFLLFGLVLDSKTYGSIAVLLTTANLFVVLLDLGLPLLLQRSGAESSPDGARAIGGIVVLRAATLVPVVAAYTVVARLLLGENTSPATIVAVGVYVLAAPLAQTVLIFLRGTRHTRVEGRVVSAQSAVELAAAALWFWSGSRDPVPLFAGLGAIRMAFVAGLVLSGGATMRAVDLSATMRFVRANRGSLALYFALAVAQFAMLQADSLVLSVLRPTEEVGRYFACARIAWLLHLPSELLLGASMSRLATATTNRDTFRRILTGVHRLSAMWTVVLVAAVAGQPSTVAGVLLGAEVGDVSDLLPLVVTAASLSWLPPFALPLALERRPVDVVIAYVAAALVTFAAQLVCVPQFGAPGAAYAAMVGYGSLKVMTLFLFARRRLSPLVLGELAPALVLAAGCGLLHLLLGERPLAALAALATLGTIALASQLGWTVRTIEENA